MATQADMMAEVGIMDCRALIAGQAHVVRFSFSRIIRHFVVI
jgi:hypothetical protein